MITQSFTIFIITNIIIGLCIGSFLNVLIHRLPRMMDKSWRGDVTETLRHWQSSDEETDADKTILGQAADMLESSTTRLYPTTYNLVTPNSSCPRCQHPIRPWENIPVISFLFLKAKCSACKAPISWRYPSIELVTGILSGLAAWHFGPTLQLGGALVLIWFLVALTMIDIDTQLLPDSMTLPLVWLGLLFNMNHDAFISLPEAVIGAIAGYLILWSVYWVFKLLTGKEGMGYGDFKLLAALGAWLGAMHLPVIILAASVSGLVIALVQMAGKQLGWGQRFPFGPYLAAGGLLALFWGKPILTWYLGG